MATVPTITVICIINFEIALTSSGSASLIFAVNAIIPTVIPDTSKKINKALSRPGRMIGQSNSQTNAVVTTSNTNLATLLTNVGNAPPFCGSTSGNAI